MDNENIPNNDMNTGNVESQNQETAMGGPEPGNQGNSEEKNGLDTLLGGKQNVPEIYDFSSSIPEGSELDEDTAKAFGDILRPLGINNEQANAIAKFGFDWADQLATAYQQQLIDENEANIKAAMKELGSDFEATKQKAGIAVEHLEKQYPNIRELFSASPVFSSVEFLKAMAEFGSLLQEDTGMGGKPVPAGKGDNPYPNTDFSRYK